MYSRREFNNATLSALSLLWSPKFGWPAKLAVEDAFHGVKVGITSYSLNPIPNVSGKDVVDVVISECLELGVEHVELFLPALEPRLQGAAVGGQVPDPITAEYTSSRQQLREWRLTTDVERFGDVRKKFDAAAINLMSYVITISDDFTDQEIDAVFKQMAALQVQLFSTNQTRASMGLRLRSFAEKYKIRPAWHTHALVNDPNEVASPESLQKLLDMSPYFMVNLDIGHFTAGNNDAVKYIREHHDRITHLHLKDRKRNNGPNVAWGAGDTPIKQCLTLIRDNRYPIYCIIEREFKGTGTPLEETRDDLNYIKKALS